MNKQEAIDAMLLGLKVTHRYMSDDEYVTSDPDGLVYTFEDGVSQKAAEFWSFRPQPQWDTDWELFK